MHITKTSCSYPLVLFEKVRSVFRLRNKKSGDQLLENARREFQIMIADQNVLSSE